MIGSCAFHEHVNCVCASHGGPRFVYHWCWPCGLLHPVVYHALFLHADIKTANCFLTSAGNLKIGDMNVSKLMKAGFLKVLCVCGIAMHTPTPTPVPCRGARPCFVQLFPARQWRSALSPVGHACASEGGGEQVQVG